MPTVILITTEYLYGQKLWVSWGCEWCGCGGWLRNTPLPSVHVLCEACYFQKLADGLKP